MLGVKVQSNVMFNDIHGELGGVENLEGLNCQPRNDFKRMEVLVWKQSLTAPNIGGSGCNSPSNNKRSH